jgi:hypothetical protein
LHEVVQHPQTYTGFKQVFPKANDRFWNPSISWERKYDDPYPLSRTFPIFTDAYHLTNAVRTVGLIGSTMYITIGKNARGGITGSISLSDRFSMESDRTLPINISNREVNKK